MNKLPSNIIHSLSSGQVITSIHDIIKELVENSLDAYATRIEIRLDNYGLDKIEVCDDGKGVPADEVQFMTLPHYTSKFSSIDDFDKLLTYGFRGEALSSLCSVSDVSITTKTSNDEFAFTYTFGHDGVITSKKISPPRIGTTVKICNIFKTLPVRRQFYCNAKKRKEELKQIEAVLNAFGIITPKLRISLTHNKNIIFVKNSLPDLTASLNNVLGSNVMSCMNHQVVDDSALQLHLDAFLPKSSNINLVTRCQNDRAYFFVNKRPIMCKIFDKLLKNSFYASFKNGENSSQSRFPIYCVCLEMPPHDFDINLEPNKTKILFRQKEAILNIFNQILVDAYQKPTASDGDVQQIRTHRNSKEDCEVIDNLNVTKITETEETAELPKENNESSSENVVAPTFFDDSINTMNCRYLEEENNVEVNDLDLDLVETLINLENVNTKKNTENNSNSKKLSEKAAVTVKQGESANLDDFDAIFAEENFNSNWRKGDLKDCQGHLLEPVQVALPHTKRTFSQLETDEERNCEKDGGCVLENSFMKLASKKKCLQNDESQPTLLTMGISSKSAELPNRQFIHDQKAEKSKPDCDLSTLSKVVSIEKEKLANEEMKNYEGCVPGKMATISAKRNSEKMKLSSLKNKKTLNAVAKVAKAKSSETANTVQVKVVNIECSLTSIAFRLKNRFIFNKKRNQKHLIGPLSKGLWLGSLDENLFMFNYFQGKELFLYQQLIENHIVCAKMLENPIILNEILVGGAANWMILMELPSIPAQPSSTFSITDNQLIANGIRVKKWFDLNSQSMKAEITHVPSYLSFCGAADLQEILQKIVTNRSVALSESRPAKVKNYLKSEAMRIVHQMPSTVTEGEVKQFWKEFGDSLDLESKCLHGKNVLFPIYELSDCDEHNCEEIL